MSEHQDLQVDSPEFVDCFLDHPNIEDHTDAVAAGDVCFAVETGQFIAAECGDAVCGLGCEDSVLLLFGDSSFSEAQESFNLDVLSTYVRMLKLRVFYRTPLYKTVL